MTFRPFAIAIAGMLATLPGTAAESKKDPAKEKAALAELGEYIGQWNLAGTDAKKTVLKETWVWGWKFGKDGADPAMSIEIKDGKTFTGATVGYDTDKKEYKVSLKGKDGKEQAYVGKIAKGKFTMERTDETSKDIHRVVTSIAGGGIRLNMEYEVVTGGKGLGTSVYKASGNKEGESFAGGGKKPECIVTGGAGTIGVSFMGKNYFVCCSGCKDEFNANPKKYVDESEKKKK